MIKIKNLFFTFIFMMGALNISIFAQEFKSAKLETLRIEQSTSIHAKSIQKLKLSSSLNTLYELYKENKDFKKYALKSKLELVDDKIVVVEVYPQYGRTTSDIDEKALIELGGVVQAKAELSMLVEIPIERLHDVAENVKGIWRIRQPLKPKAFEVIGEGPFLMEADEWHSAGYTGADAKVAVIDLGFNLLDSAQANGDIPPTYVSHDFTGTGLQTGTQHGTAVAEAVYDVAPDAELYLYKIGTFTHLQLAEDTCEMNNIHVINHSVGWYLAGGYYDGTGYVCDVANEAIDYGIVWVNAAGNEADGFHYRGVFDDDGIGYHDFSGAGGNINVFGPAPGQGYIYQSDIDLSVFLNWDDYPGSDQDYDLHVVRLAYPSGTQWQIVASSTNPQTGTQYPEEEIHTQTRGGLAFYGVVVEKVNATVDVDFTLFNWFDTWDYYQASSSLVDPATVEEVVTVGAIHKDNYDSGPQEPYSSQGPTNDGRIKPDVTAPDNCICFAYGGDFGGTSQASPHVAGVCALIKSAFPTHTVDNIKDYLYQDCTVDLGVAGKDNIYGFGKVEMLSPFYVLHLGVEDGTDIFPQETALYDYYTAGASALMTLKFIDDTYAHDQDYIYTTYHQGTPGEDMNATDLRNAMNGEEPGPYHFSAFAEADEDLSLKKIVHWVDYQVPGADQSNTPAFVPVEADYNWLVVRGFVTDLDPCDQSSVWNIPDVTLYWLWLNDPRTSGLGYNAYVSAQVFKDSYYDPVEGSYRSICEPPDDFDSNTKNDIYRNVELTYARAKTDNQLAENLNSKIGVGTYDWKKLLPEPLMAFDEFNEIFSAGSFSKTLEVVDLDSQEDYYLVAMNNGKSQETANLVIMLNTDDAAFEGASWVKKETPYLPLQEEKAVEIAISVLGNSESGKYYDYKNPSEILLVWTKNFNSSRFLPSYEVIFNSVVKGYDDIAVFVHQDETYEIGSPALKKEQSQKTNSLIPDKFALHQNYPNPFNPSTKITYAIANNSKVNLTIYNTLGQEVAVLVNTVQTAGNYSVTFSVGNLPSGVYFYRLTTNSFSEVKKMVITK
ncbi:MAG: S8/S53 family peptidase [Ignavibacteria bacterium]|jgi:hypothetical protein